MRITIITPSYNQGPYLEQAIDSVLSQSYPDLEYIIIDGGSTDGSVNLIKKYEKYLTFWTSEKDKGQSDAINKGLQLATGEVIHWLNSDDYYQPQALRTISEQFAKPQIVTVCARSNIVKDGRIIQHSKGTDVYAGNLPKTIGWARIDQPATFFRKTVYERVGLLNESLHYLMDREWWIRYLFQYGLDGILQIEDTVVNFRLHDSSKTESQKEEFEKENALLFWSLARHLDISHISNFMESLWFKKPPNQKISFPIRDNHLAMEAVHYFLLLKADQKYFQFNHKEAKKILSHIDPAFLDRKDERLMRGLSLKTILPPDLIKILRLWK